ncbi:unnamed protein product [Schistosoma margrebowiei]|uniref:Uncharacterized protein n=1 Tax=Schistosoma margrebowiei TaxID=48269 RepID=A0A3P8DUG0_9TREM|nr:unnamed protein product [Schistosoma margrebowiei]
MNLTYRILSAAGFKNDESEAVLSPYTAQVNIMLLLYHRLL